LKAVAATWIVCIQLTHLARLLEDDLLARGGTVLQSVRALFGA
jgi:hypothetical protein